MANPYDKLILQNLIQEAEEEGLTRTVELLRHRQKQQQEEEVARQERRRQEPSPTELWAAHAAKLNAMHHEMPDVNLVQECE